MVTTVDFYLGIGSRYSYLAASQIDRIEAQTGCRFVWKPIASGLLIDRRGDNPFRGATGPGVGPGQYDQTYREYDAKGWAAFYGIPFHEPFALEVDPMLPALACCPRCKSPPTICRLIPHSCYPHILCPVPLCKPVQISFRFRYKQTHSLDRIDMFIIIIHE